MLAARRAVSVRHLPVLDPARDVVEERVREACHVADGDHAGAALDAQVVVAHQAVGEVETVVRQPPGGGCRADRLDEDVALDHGAVGEDHASAVVVDGEGRDAAPEVEAHLPLVASLHGGTHLPTEGGLHGHLVEGDDVDLATQPHGGGGDLAADEPGAQDDQPGAGREPLLQRSAVVVGADDVPAGPDGLGEASGLDAGGRDEPVVGHRLPSDS